MSGLRKEYEEFEVVVKKGGIGEVVDIASRKDRSRD